MKISAVSTIDILKVDIEGAEKQIFAAKNEWLKKVKIIVIELHGTYSRRDFEEDVGTKGFKVLPPNPGFGNRMIFALSPEAPGIGSKL